MEIPNSVKNFFSIRKAMYGALDNDYEFMCQITRAVDLINESIKNGGKILTFGNGGSALQAAHITVELEGRFKRDRRAIPAICLSTDIAKLTALGNDFGYSSVFVRQMEAHCQKGDVVIGLTTSDASEDSEHSRNILEGFKMAKQKGAKCVGLFSIKTVNLLGWVDVAVVAPSSAVDLVQEIHDSAIHIICGLVEEEL